MRIRFNSSRSSRRRPSIVPNHFANWSAITASVASTAMGCGEPLPITDNAPGHLGRAGSNSAPVIAEVDFEPGERVQDDDFARGFLPDQWAGYAVGLRAPKVHYLYPLVKADSGSLLVDPPDEASRELLRTLAAEAGPGAMVTFREGHAYLIVPVRSEELHRKVEAMLDRAYDEIEDGKSGEQGDDKEVSDAEEAVREQEQQLLPLTAVDE